MSKLSLIKISPFEYQNLQEKNKAAIYWLDDGSIYIGDHLYGGKFAIISKDPDSPELNTLYINLKENTLKIYDGKKLVSIALSTERLKGKLTIGDKVYDGSADVTIETYNGEIISDQEIIKLVTELQLDRQAIAEPTVYQMENQGNKLESKNKEYVMQIKGNTTNDSVLIPSTYKEKEVFYCNLKMI